jgi:integrase/recombinase XerD
MERFIIYSKEYRDQYGRFMKYLQAIGYSEASWKTFTTGLREFFCWLEKQKILSLEKVSESDIENFYSYQQERPNNMTGGTLSESRITIHMYVIKLLFCYLEDTEQLLLNPMSNLDYTHSYKRTRENLLSLADIEKLYQVCDTVKQRAILGIIYGCGLRRQEAAKLNVRDIQFKSGLLYVRQGKGGRKRTVPLNTTVLKDLKEYYYNERSIELNGNDTDSIEAFMVNKHGRRMRGITYTLEVKKLIKAAGLNTHITLHHFRHAIATHLLESGMKTGHVKDFLGHQSIETTQTYLHLTTTQMKKTTSYGTETIPD